LTLVATPNADLHTPTAQHVQHGDPIDLEQSDDELLGEARALLFSKR
jgi:hypothetical protein